ncbi:MAG: hypothetical protein BWY11_01941 [Firmicutes bacterium ADurb.Bin182]|nr:MAG: hypothetical protein BWY11_01941 [Firmicutes bacterium ADurb.Bin182]
MIIDRFEGGRAICENNGSFVEIDISDLPPEASEGDVIEFDESGKLFVDRQETARRKKRIKDLMEKLFK